MNNQILQLQTLSQSLQDTLEQLLQEDGLTQIDRDYLKHQCIQLYDQISKLNVAEKPSLIIANEEAPKSEALKPEITTNKIEEEVKEPVSLNETIQQPLFVEPKPKDENIKILEQAENTSPKTETEIKNSQIDQILETQQHKNILPEAEVELSLHEKIAHSIEPKENLIEKLSSSIPSLKNAINVNLKIAFVNQLFNENTVEYVKAIDKLNSCENIHEAMRYFNELKHTYAWESENMNVKELEQLIHKRYN